MKKKVVLGVTMFAAAALTMSGCAAPDPDSGSTSDDPYRFAIVFGQTGFMSAYAPQYFKGVDAAVEDINASGGINGRQLEVEIVDSKSDPTVAVSALTELLDSGYEPDAVTPDSINPSALALLPLLTEREIFSISVAATNGIVSSEEAPYHFGGSLPLSDQQAILGEMMVDEGVKTLGVIVGGDAEGDAYLGGIEKVAEDNGIEIIAVERPDPAALNFSVEFQRIVSANPDAIFSDLASADASARLFDARLALNDMDRPYFVGLATASVVPATIADPLSIENCFMPVFTSTVKQDDPPAQLLPLLEAFEGSDTSAFVGGLAYDTVRVLQLALERSDGDTSAQALTDALLGEPVPAGVLTLYPEGTTYTADNHYPSIVPGTMQGVPCTATIVDGLWTAPE